MPKRQYPDYQSITGENFTDIQRDVKALVFHWLKKENKAPLKHWESMFRQFMEQVWVHRKRFDRNRGKLTTWLTWQWKSFAKDCKRAGETGHLDDIPLRTGDWTNTLKKQISQTNWGLAPESAAISYQDLETFRKTNAYAERLLNEDPEALLVLEDAVSRLPEVDRKLLELHYNGAGNEGISLTLGIPEDEVVLHLERIEDRIKGILAGRIRRERSSFRFGPSDVYWQEYFKQMLKTWPLATNKYEDAQEARIRKAWGVK